MMKDCTSQLYGMIILPITLAKTNTTLQISSLMVLVKDVVPYLTRRAQENTSVAGQTGRELSLLKKIGKTKKEN